MRGEGPHGRNSFVGGGLRWKDGGGRAGRADRTPGRTLAGGPSLTAKTRLRPCFSATSSKTDPAGRPDAGRKFLPGGSRSPEGVPGCSSDSLVRLAARMRGTGCLRTTRTPGRVEAGEASAWRRGLTGRLCVPSAIPCSSWGATEILIGMRFASSSSFVARRAGNGVASQIVKAPCASTAARWAPS